MKSFALPVILATILTSWVVQAAEFPVKARLFAGSAAVSPKDLNTELEAYGLKKMDRTFQFGAEATYPVAKYAEFGFRYARHYAKTEENPADVTTQFESELTQDSVYLIGRVPFLQSKIVRADVFAGVGGSNTTVKIKSATAEGEHHKKESGDWFATPITAFGASVGVGYKMFYFVVEGGFETNTVTGLKHTGTVSTDVSKLDLSGGYFSAGVMFNGITAKSQ